jgi:Got1/Sft2-like family
MATTTSGEQGSVGVANSGSGSGNRGWFDVESSGSGSMASLLPVFSGESMVNQMQQLQLHQPAMMSWNSMRQSMENSMPKQILGMNYAQRFRVFCGLLLVSALFFALAFFVGLPLMAIRPQKFALSFTCGSLTFMASFAILRGPAEHLSSMLHRDRLAFTGIYLASMLVTLYCTFSHGGASGYVLVLSASAIQLISLLWYLISFLPGGAAGLKYVLAVVGHMLQPVLITCARFQATCLSRCAGWGMTLFRSSE